MRLFFPLLATIYPLLLPKLPLPILGNLREIAGGTEN